MNFSMLERPYARKREAAARFAASLASRVAPWGRSARQGRACGLPANAKTGEPFDDCGGINPWLMEIAAIAEGFVSPLWASAEEWASLGGTVPGDGGTAILSMGLESRWVTVYNRDECEVAIADPEPIRPDYALAQRLLDGTGACVRRDRPVGDLECYYYFGPPDWIQVPEANQFSHPDVYWSTMFHELAHWAIYGKQRLNWDAEFPSKITRGELAADLTAALLTNHCGLVMDGDLVAQREHVPIWVSAIRTQFGYLSDCLDVASRAYQYIVSGGALGKHTPGRNDRQQKVPSLRPRRRQAVPDPAPPLLDG